MALHIKRLIGLTILYGSINASYISICKNCHGKNFEKRALGKSKVVKNMKKKDIIKRLKYFKTSNSIMKSFAAPLTDKQIEAIGNVFGK